MSDIERKMIELQSHMASLAMEIEMLNKKLREDHAEVRDAMMNYKNALRRYEDAKLMEEEDADSD